MKTNNSFVQSSIQQIKKLIPILTVSYLLLLAILLSVFIIGEYHHVPFSKFTRDPAQILDGHPLDGALSNIGILFWCSAAAICFFCSAIQWKYKKSKNSKFLLFSGLITFLLLLDDLFMFHETLFPTYLHIPEAAVFMGYLIFISIFLLKFKEDILKAEYILLCMALGFFALSMISDVFLLQGEFTNQLEDGTKLFGIVTWFMFFVRTCFVQMQEVLPSKSQDYFSVPPTKIQA